MKSVFLFPNEKKDTELLYTKRAMEYLKARGCRVYSIAELPGAESVNGEPPADLQFAVILGGDGTILRGAHYLLGTNTPILGVNLGTLGYMAEVEPNGIEAALLAPTAMNQQKFCFALRKERVSVRAGRGFYTKVDLGIVKYHFEIGAGQSDWTWDERA